LRRPLEWSPVVQRPAFASPSVWYAPRLRRCHRARAGLREAVISERRLPADSWPLGRAGDVLTHVARRGRPFAARRNRHVGGALAHGIARCGRHPARAVL